jgi:hypothetical protein
MSPIGEVHMAKGCCYSLIIDMFWLIPLAYPKRVQEGDFICSNEDYLPSRRLEKGSGESAPCGTPLDAESSVKTNILTTLSTHLKVIDAGQLL